MIKTSCMADNQFEVERRLFRYLKDSSRLFGKKTRTEREIEREQERSEIQEENKRTKERRCKCFSFKSEVFHPLINSTIYRGLEVLVQ